MKGEIFLKQDYQYNKDWFLYDEELIEKMYQERIYGIPISFYLLDYRKTDTHCKQSSDLLVHCLLGSNRVSGDIPSIIGNDKYHSWVEKDNLVYDAYDGIVWIKDSFYEKYQPSNIVVHRREESENEINNYLDATKNSIEVYKAWVVDLKQNISKLIYNGTLLEHIERFEEEKSLNSSGIDLKLVDKYLNELQKLYHNIEQFKEEALQEEMNGRK